MGGLDFDRRTYIRSRPPERPPFPIRKLSVAVGLALAGLCGFMVYESLEGGGAAAARNDNPELAQMQQRLDALEHRLDQMERRHKALSVEPPAPATKQEPANVTPQPSRPAVRTIYRISPAPNPAPLQPSVEAGVVNPKDLDSSRHDVELTREEWEATADRMGLLVGELASQKNEIARNREALNQLSEGFRRSTMPLTLHMAFTLQKGGNRQQVGPVGLRLQSTDPKNHRYTMWLYVDDRSIELKDRAWHEAIQFSAPDGKASLELAVSEITKHTVAGRLALPEAAARR